MSRSKYLLLVLLLSLFASSPTAQDPRRQLLIARVIEDFIRLSAADADTELK